MTVTLYPTAAIRGLIDDTAADPELSVEAKSRALTLLREELSVLVGACDREIQGARKLAEAEHLVQTEAQMHLRENADIREEMIQRGLATPQQMDAAGYRSHEQLDVDLAERLGLEEALVSSLRRKWAELKHPRGRGGRFREVPGSGMLGTQTKGGKVKRVLEDTQTGAKIPVFHGQPGRPPGGGPDAYEQRRVAQEKRTASVVEERSKGAVGRGDPTNVLGRISQASLLAYLNLTKTRPSTTDLHSSEDPKTGKRIWDADRAEVHQRIATAILNKRGPDGKVCYDCEQIPGHAAGDREVVFMGGGYAAGKGSVQDSLVLTGPGGSLHGARPPTFDENWNMTDPGDKNSTFLALDPDEIKGELEEFQQAALDDPEANLLVYEEAWHISQLVQRMAQARGVDVLVDGISNTSPDEVAKRMESFTGAGYKPPKFHYVSVPTDVAVERAMKRAREATKMSDKRYIPEQVMRAVHRDVSATVTALMHDPRFKDATVSVYNTEERGNPRLAAQKMSGKIGEEVTDAELWDTFKAKGLESVTGVTDDPQHARYLQGLITDEEKQANDPTPRQAWGRTRGGAEGAVPGLQAEMTDALGALAERLDAKVHGGPEPFDKEVLANGTGMEVLIAPPKDLNEAEKKVRRKMEGDWSHVPDLVRGSVVVNHEQDLGHAIAEMRAELAARGWTVVGVVNRFANVPESNTDAGPTTAGYKDVKIEVQTASGNHFELQFHVRPLWVAKELGGPETGDVPGHRLYKMGQRLVDEIGNHKPTEDQTVELNQIHGLQHALYSRAAWDSRRSVDPRIRVSERRPESPNIGKLTASDPTPLYKAR